MKNLNLEGIIALLEKSKEMVVGNATDGALDTIEGALDIAYKVSEQIEVKKAAVFTCNQMISKQVSSLLRLRSEEDNKNDKILSNLFLTVYKTEEEIAKVVRHYDSLLFRSNTLIRLIGEAESELRLIEIEADAALFIERAIANAEEFTEVISSDFYIKGV